MNFIHLKHQLNITFQIFRFDLLYSGKILTHTNFDLDPKFQNDLRFLQQCFCNVSTYSGPFLEIFRPF